MPDRAYFPPAGTKCSDCGCCPAAVYAGNAAICFECDNAEPCAAKKAAAREPVARVEAAHTRIGRAGMAAARALRESAPKPKPAKPVEEPEKASLAAALPDLRTRFDRDEDDLPGAHVPKASDIVAAQDEAQPPARRGKYAKIPDDVRAAILAAPLTTTNEDLARRFDISNVSVSLIRRKAGQPRRPTGPIDSVDELIRVEVQAPLIDTTGKNNFIEFETEISIEDARRMFPIAPARELWPEPSPQERLDQSCEIFERLRPGELPPVLEATISVTRVVTAAQLDAYWASLSLDQKAGLIELSLLTILDRAQAPNEPRAPG